uniref:sensor histidine kinase n=1 Tax=Eubacterium cellulosolvens TaxID=29322 RepID=UPI000686AFBA|nr:histidine kinase [[Eubacterium] cellulosolvens]
MLYDVLIRALAAVEIGIILNADGIANFHIVMSICFLLCMEISVLCPKKEASDFLAALPFAAAFLLLAFEESPQLLFKTAMLLLFLLSYLLETVLFRKYQVCRDRLHRTRDDSVEMRDLLQARNRHLLDEQDQEIHLATMTERNRIAREIHDNVGHMLSRAILLLGAIEAVNSDEKTAPQLAILDRTLDSAMQKMRESVHDLHDTSIDLQKNIDDMLTDLKNFEVNCDVDFQDLMPTSTKLTLLGIFREAVTNILKHSNGNRVDVILHQNPGFCILSVTDNGTSARDLSPHEGIGLVNMRQRAQSCGGDVYFYRDSGFTVYARLPYQTPEN